MAKVSEIEAKSIIREELARARWDTASSLTVRDGARPEAERLDWWSQNTPTDETSETPRSIAYLRAYLRIAADAPLYAGGLILARRRLWMDRSIMSRFVRDGYLSFVTEKNPHFKLTEKGEALLREWSPPE